MTNDPLRDVFGRREIKSRPARVNPDTGVEYTVRECTGCGAVYTWPKGERAPGSLCPRCQPNLPGMPT